MTVDHGRTWNWSGLPVRWMSRSASLRSAHPRARSRHARRRQTIGTLTRGDASGLRVSRSYEVLKPRESLVQLLHRLAMAVVVHPHTLEERRVERLERPEVIAVGGRDFSDERSRFARP